MTSSPNGSLREITFSQIFSHCTFCQETEKWNILSYLLFVHMQVTINCCNGNWYKGSIRTAHVSSDGLSHCSGVLTIEPFGSYRPLGRKVITRAVRLVLNNFGENNQLWSKLRIFLSCVAVANYFIVNLIMTWPWPRTSKYSNRARRQASSAHAVN